MMKNMTLLLITAMALGCGKSEAPKQGPKAAIDPDITIPQSLIGRESAPDPSEVLVEVNGNKLTRGETMRQVRLRLGGPPPADMPTGRADKIREITISQVIDQFVKRTLLLSEADRLNIIATEDEIRKGLEIIKAQAPRNSVPSGALTDGHADSDSLRNEVIIGIRIDKLLAKVLPEPTVADGDVEDILAAARSNLSADEKNSLPSRERVTEIVRQRERRGELAKYLRSLLKAAEIRHSPSVKLPADLTEQ